jgi:hypothetical protein
VNSSKARERGYNYQFLATVPEDRRQKDTVWSQRDFKKKRKKSKPEKGFPPSSQ